MSSDTNVSLLFSERLKFLREEKELTQKQLAKELNILGFDITDNMISSYERGIWYQISCNYMHYANFLILVQIL